MRRCKLVFCYGDYEQSVYFDSDESAVSLAGKLDDMSSFFDEHDVYLEAQGSAKGEKWRFQMYTEIVGT